MGIFTRMDNQAKRDPLLMEPYHQVHYALVGLADEVVLTSGWEHSTAWRQALLEERFYNSQEAGNRFFELANNLDQAPQDVVAIFYLCLALGFSGRYAPADPELAEVKEKLLARLPSKPRIMEEPPNVGSHQDRRMRGWLWSAAVVALVAAAVTLGWERWEAYQDAKVSAPPAPVEKPAQEAASTKPKAGDSAKVEIAQKPAVPVQPEARVTSKAEIAQKPAAPVQPEASPQVKPATSATSEPVAEPAPAAAFQPGELRQAEAAKQPAEPPQAPPEKPAPSASTAGEQAAAAPSAPPGEPEKTQAPQTASPKKTYRVRVGVYVGPIQSGRFADILQKAGFPSSVEKLERPGGKVLYVVSITPLASLDEAEQIRAEVREKFKVKGVIKQN